MKANSRTKNSFLNAASSFGGQFLTIILKFVTRTIFIQTLGVEYLGINGLFVDILTMLSLTELGLDTAMNYRLYKPVAEKNERTIRIYLKFYKNAYRVIGLVIFILGLLLIPSLRFLIKDYDNLATLGINATLVFLLYLMQSVASYLFFAYKSVVVRIYQKEYILNLVSYIIIIATNAAQIAVLLIWKNFVAYVALFLVFAVLQNFIYAIITQRLFPKLFIKEKDSLSWAEIKNLIKDCGALFVYKVNGVVIKASNNLILSAFIGLSIVGLYSNYLLFYMTIRTVFAQLYKAVKASMGNLYATSNVEQQYFFFEITNYITAILYGTAAVGIAVVADELISVWIGNDFIIARPFALLIGIEIFFVGINSNLGQIRSITGVFRQMWYRPLMGIVINLVVSIVLVQFIGIYGVIIGTISAQILTNFMIDPSVIHKHAFQNYKPVSKYYVKNITYMMVLLVVGFFDWWLCSVLLPGKGWISVVLHSAICAITVPAVFLLVYWKKPELQYFVRKIKLD